MGGQSCKLKIILNGGTIYNEAELLCAQVQAPGTTELTEDQGYEIIRHLNIAEDEVFKAKAAWLKSQEYDGPLPHSLAFKS